MRLSNPAASAIEPPPILIAERIGSRLRCTLNRPEALNALNPELLEALALAVESAGDDQSVRTVSIEGAGGRAFSAGFDIKAMSGAAQGKRSHVLQRATTAVARCPKPTLALIDGYCFGAGFDLAMACDFRIATIGSRFTVPAIRLGTVYDPRSIERIWRVLGPTVTKELFMLGREFDAQRALRTGVIQEVLDASPLAEAAERWSAIPPGGFEAVLAHKRIVDAFSESNDRSARFWAPLDALRERSLQTKERAQAVEQFKRRRGTGPSSDENPKR